MLPQPTEESCGPTCLHAVYDYYGDKIKLDQVIREVNKVKGGGTLAVMLGNHALDRGYEATIYTYNLQVFDPTWFQKPVDLKQKMLDQQKAKSSKKLKQATKAYLKFLEKGGKIIHEELTPFLLMSILARQLPILTGLSATYLYQSAREIPEHNQYDDIRGLPAGHFVLISDYDHQSGQVFIADPLNPNPIKQQQQFYSVDIHRVINAILLGIVTYDANLLILSGPASCKE